MWPDACGTMLTWKQQLNHVEGASQASFTRIES